MKKYGIYSENDKIFLQIGENITEFDKNTATQLAYDIETVLKCDDFHQKIDEIKEKEGLFKLSQEYLGQFKIQIENDQKKYNELKQRLETYFSSDEYKNLTWSN